LPVALQNFHPDAQFNLVYYDAFAPNKQAELWTLDCFKHLNSFITPGGVLVTYSAKGQVRRDLEWLGYTVERLPGPPGKAEMLRAKKKLSSYNKP
jgi:tRNA U34 5-methylaminomethyl-2-thiouridine-forming methyltransferase MnmC